MQKKKEENMKKDKKVVQQKQKQLMRLQILTNKILKMRLKDKGNLKRVPFFITKIKIFIFIRNNNNF